MKLINAEELVKTLDSIKYIGNDAVTIIQNNEIERCKSFVQTAPTVEQRPDGKWIVDEDNIFYNFKKCSNCNAGAEWLDGGSQFISNYCPNCGADMREDGEA